MDPAPSVRPLREGPRPAQQARAVVEPSVPASAWAGLGRGPVVLLRAVYREGWGSLPLHGWWVGGHRDGASNLRGRRAPVPPMAAVSAGVRFEGVAGSRVRKARMGRTCDRVTLCAVPQGLLVRRFRHTPCSSGQYFIPFRLSSISRIRDLIKFA